MRGGGDCRLPFFLSLGFVMLFFERDLELYVSTVETGFNTNNTYKISALSGSSISYKSKSQNNYNYKIENNPNRLSESVPIGFTEPTFKFSTYVKPHLDTNTVAVEKLLLQSLTGTIATENPTNSITSFSSVNKLPELYLYLNYGGLYYKLSKVVVKLAEYKIDIEKITTVDWDLVGQDFEKIDTLPDIFTDYSNAGNYLKSKLSSLNITLNSSSVNGVLPIITGTLKFKNNVSVVSRETLDIRTTEHLDHYVKDRTVELNLTGYLRTGTVSPISLFEIIKSNIDYNTGVGNNNEITLNIGPVSNTHLEFYLANAQIELPEIKVSDVITSNIKITSKKLSVDNDDITIKYVI